jgi:hypothetical protein
VVGRPETVVVIDSVTSGHNYSVGVADTVGVSDAKAVSYGAHAGDSDTVSVSDAVTPDDHSPVHIGESVGVGESVAVSYGFAVHDGTTVIVEDGIVSGSGSVVANGTTLTVDLSQSVRIDGVPVLSNFSVGTTGTAFDVDLLSVSPSVSVLASGGHASVVSMTLTDGAATFVTNVIEIAGVNFTTLNAAYIFLSSPTNPTPFLRIVAVLNPTTVQVDRPILVDPLNGSVSWQATTGVTGLIFETTKFTNGGPYSFTASGLMTVGGTPYSATLPFTAVSAQPRVVSAAPLGGGQILVTYNTSMLVDTALTDPTEYKLVGPGVPAPYVESVTTVSPTQVLLLIRNLQVGSYTLTAGTHTPHDFADNPLDPSFHTAPFTIATINSSVFVDHGPISKPPLVLATGTGASVVDAVTVTLPGGLISPAMLGKLLTLSGSTVNGGTFLITSVLTSSIVKLKASLSLPDPSSGHISWEVFDPRDGQIANEPSDVMVTVNGTPVVPIEVFGLLGEIVLPAAPIHGDTVRVNYSWIDNPTVTVAALNSLDFRLNSWNRDIGYILEPRHYRYNNVLVTPSEYVATNIQAQLPQPLQRDLKYRAYERAYTALLNDPNTLTLNAPTNLIAYPPLSRIISQTFVSYEPTTLPESYPLTPWTRVGSGSAALVSLQLVVTSPTSGDYPGGTPVFWVQEVDQTFPHVFAATWDMQLNATPITQGVFTGVAFGNSDSERAIVFGYLNDGGVHKIGFLVKGAGNDPSLITAWTGGLDASGNPTNAPLVYDWSILTSYRIYEDSAGNISLYLNGAVVPNLMVTEEQLPFLEELAAPFNALQGVFWGSLSSQAANTSTWDFVRYLVLPLNPVQQAPSIYVDYVANVLPEAAAKPWTPVGYHGTETILSSAFLLLDSTSAVPAAEEIQTGLVGGDFRGFFRIEPLIAADAEVVIDFNVQLRTWTHGFSPNAMMVAVDDTDRLIQLSFITDEPAPKFSYGGDGLPTVQVPPWTPLGGQTAQMYGRTLQIVDALPLDGLVYVIDDMNPVTPDNVHWVQSAALVAGSSLAATAAVHHKASSAIVAGSIFYPPGAGVAVGPSHNFHVQNANVAIVAGARVSATATVNRGAQAVIQASANVAGNILVSPHSRVFSADNAYMLEARLQPLTWLADPTWGFIGAMAQVYDSQRTIGFALSMVAGVPSVVLQGEGVVVASFPCNWNDGHAHTYRVVYTPASPTGVVTLFVDGTLVGIPQNYTSFPEPTPASTIGFLAFGSSFPSFQSTSTVNWIYCNGWRVETGQKFVGIWRGTNTGSLVDFWVPTKVTGENALIVGNALMDTTANFIAAGVTITDYLIVDDGPNKGIYQVTGVMANTLAIDATWPANPSRINYRIAQQTDWTQPHAYRIAKAPSGDDVAVFLDSSPTPLIFLTYDDSILPPSQLGLPRVISGNLSSVVWGAFDPTNLSQSSWQYLRYGVTRSPTELRIIPPHQVLNQRNLIESFERHLSNIPHTLTDFWSESEGIVPNTYPDFLENPGLIGTTLLNEHTPLVPKTQTYEVQKPTPTVEFVGGLNNIANVLNANSFLLNDATRRVALIVPNDVLYSSLQVIPRVTGTPNLIADFNDQSSYGAFYFQQQVCLTYDAKTLPENDTTAITPWTFFAQDPSHVTRSVFGGVLTYGTDSVGTQTLYRNATPLPDAPSMETSVKFRLKVLLDSSGGLGDSQVRFGFSAIGLTASLALVSAPTGLRYVLVIDQLSNQVIGGIPFDFYDGNYHEYRLVRKPGEGIVQVYVDS